MLLRRIGRHVKEQNWTAISLDFLIVVLGVFIGLQAANWNEERVASQMEKTYLLRLHEDLMASAQQLQSDVDFLYSQFHAQRVVRSALESCRVNETDEREFNFGVASLGFINPPRLYRRTIDELTFSGRLDLVKSEEIKDRLAAVIDQVEFRDRVSDAVQRRTEQNRHFVEQFVTYNVQVADYSMAPELIYDIEEMCQDKRVIRSISSVSFSTAERINAYEDVLQDYRDILPIIDSELKERWDLRVPGTST